MLVAGECLVGRRETMTLGLAGTYAVADSRAEVEAMVADPVETLAARTARVARTWSPAALTGIRTLARPERTAFRPVREPSPSQGNRSPAKVKLPGSGETVRDSAARGVGRCRLRRRILWENPGTPAARHGLTTATGPSSRPPPARGVH